ncbi:PREDICTED: protein canopy homolog 2 [Vollenhovia emeryi]|uniref:protein canopy homolog 2 n=1 Tax=Vollenhovia emeryi TaxID=411798 RepID=UPI0005F3C39F|nr:PREDICTED: protein canopy homolog 2 [Vollenhovia emeryi]
MRTLLLFGLFCMVADVELQQVDLKHLKCLVCRATMDELESEVLRHNPEKLVTVGSFRMDAEGNTVHKKIPLGRSELHLSAVLETICSNLENYVRATRKSDKQLVIFNLMSPSGGMNPIMSEVDVIQDGDLNKSLQHYCHAIVEEFEDDILSLFIDGVENREKELCTKISRICSDYDEDNDDSDYDVDTDFNFDRDEL